MTTAWRDKALGEVATLQRGFDLPVGRRIAGPFTVLAANGPVGTHSEPKVDGPGVVTGRSGSIGRVHYVPNSFWPLNTALYVKDFRGNEPRWVYWLLRSMDLQRYSEGTGVPTLNRNIVHRVHVAVPPVAEQRRIAAVLDQADELRAKRQSSLVLIDSLNESIFLDMFAGPGNPRGWPCPLLDDVVEFLDHMRKPITAADRVPGPIPYYGANGVQDFVEGYLFDEPLVLLAEDGGHFDDPARGIAYRIEGKSWVNNHAHVLRPKGGVDSHFLAQSLRHRDVRAHLTGSTRAKLTKSSAARIPIPLPPPELQSQYAQHVRRAQSLADVANRGATAVASLFDSLQHRAFTGQL